MSCAACRCELGAFTHFKRHDGHRFALCSKCRAYVTHGCARAIRELGAEITLAKSVIADQTTGNMAILKELEDALFFIELIRDREPAIEDSKMWKDFHAARQAAKELENADTTTAQPDTTKTNGETR